ncbi:MAG TPA: hypothetical protein VI875_04050 [Candidatus Norongarragalinales archaeon]|nr:hypothetical protein [Candidatus Norongarragalinales archaeon]
MTEPPFSKEQLKNAWDELGLQTKPVFASFKLGNKTIHIIGYRHGEEGRVMPTPEEVEQMKKYIAKISGKKTILMEGVAYHDEPIPAEVQVEYWREELKKTMPNAGEIHDNAVPLEPGITNWVTKARKGEKASTTETDEVLEALLEMNLTKEDRERFKKTSEYTRQMLNISAENASTPEEFVKVISRNHPKKLFANLLRELAFAQTVSTHANKTDAQHIVAMVGIDHFHTLQALLQKPKLAEKLTLQTPRIARNALRENGRLNRRIIAYLKR